VRGRIQAIGFEERKVREMNEQELQDLAELAESLRAGKGFEEWTSRKVVYQDAAVMDRGNMRTGGVINGGVING
jgi:hypothetical protein